MALGLLWAMDGGLRFNGSKTMLLGEERRVKKEEVECVGGGLWGLVPLPPHASPPLGTGSRQRGG